MRVVRSLGLIDTPTDVAFDDITRFAAWAVDAPMAAVSVIDQHRQWFKSNVGLPWAETPRDVAFCNHAILADEPIVVADALLDARFASNPLVTGPPYVRSYVGVPVRVGRFIVGTVCVLDRVPRGSGERDLEVLQFLGRQVERLIESHRQHLGDVASDVAGGDVDSIATRISSGVQPRVALEAARWPGWVFDAETLRIVEVNSAALEQYGWTREQFQTLDILDLRPDRDRAVLAVAVANATADAYARSRTWQHRRADGTEIEVEIRTAESTIGGRPHRVVAAIEVSRGRTIAAALERAAYVDYLTGLANRPAFVRHVELALLAKTTVGVLFVDLDRFKLVNDTMGHDHGDLLLCAAAARIRALAPAPSCVARHGGDEFAIAIDAGVRDPSALADQIRAALEQPFSVAGVEHYLSASVGITRSGVDASAQDLLAEADTAMYEAKGNGRNSCVEFNAHLRDAMTEWSLTRSELRRGLQRDEIEIDLQPILDRCGRVEAYEALARWNHPTRGRLTPHAFLTVAEESGLIAELGTQVLQLAAAHAATTGARISVNVSMLQFNRSLVHAVDRVVARYGLQPSQLIIEITESAVTSGFDPDLILSELRRAGADVWIDNFGTGFSSLARLAQLAVDGLKLSREFVADTDQPRGLGIARAICELGRAVGVQVIAEGVETAEQLAAVEELGCDLFQGYLLGRPTAEGIDLEHLRTLTA